jgi:hypothetical protein
MLAELPTSANVPTRSAAVWDGRRLGMVTLWSSKEFTRLDLALFAYKLSIGKVDDS